MTTSVETLAEARGFTDDEARRIRAAVGTWLECLPEGQHPHMADAHHSALLGRLLSGGKPLGWPPPRSFSYPWYELCDSGTVEANMEVNVYSDGLPDWGFDGPAVNINQSLWHLKSRSGDTYMVQWPDEKAPWVCRLTVLERSARDPNEVPDPWRRWRLEVVAGPTPRPNGSASSKENR